MKNFVTPRLSLFFLTVCLGRSCRTNVFHVFDPSKEGKNIPRDKIETRHDTCLIVKEDTTNKFDNQSEPGRTGLMTVKDRIGVKTA